MKDDGLIEHAVYLRHHISATFINNNITVYMRLICKSLREATCKNDVRALLCILLFMKITGE
jgi:hypothetical protein